MLASLEHPSKTAPVWEDERMHRAPPYKLAVVVAGGAARGAYEAGVIRFVFQSLAPRIGLSLWPRIVCGSSVGAFNAAVLASGSEDALERMSKLWRELRIEQIYSVHWRGWRRIESDRPFGLLDARPLDKLLSSEFPAQPLRASLASGRCETLVITATDLATGRNVLFVDTAERTLPKRLGSNQIATEISAVHCRASSAIPFLFSPVQIGARFYVDGGLRHNTPLRPALRAGAERILVIGTKAHQDRDDPGPEHVPTPTLAFLAGKTLNALLLDPVERDLQQVRRTNRFLDWGEGEYGYRIMTAGYEGFIDQEACLHHNVGGKSFDLRQVALGPLRFTMLTAPPIRCYYGCRNMLYFLLYEAPRRQPKMIVRTVLGVARQTVSYLLEPRRHREHLRACLRGFWHGVTGNIAARY